jgi:hypothetical protein
LQNKRLEYLRRFLPQFCGLFVVKCAKKMPLYRFELEVTIPPDMVAQRLRSSARESPGLLATIPLGFVPKHAELNRDGGPDRPFVGSVQNHSFRFYRFINYFNLFLPQVSGRITATSKGSRVTVTMFLHPIACAFVVVWLLALGTGAWKAFAGNQASDASLYGPIGGIVFMLVLVTSGFFPEAIKAKHLLQSILRGSPNAPLNRTRTGNERAS